MPDLWKKSSSSYRVEIVGVGELDRSYVDECGQRDKTEEGSVEYGIFELRGERYDSKRMKDPVADENNRVAEVGHVQFQQVDRRL